MNATRLRALANSLGVMRRRLRRAIEDLEFEAAGGVILWAADFSEIHEYIHRQQVRVPHDFREPRPRGLEFLEDSVRRSVQRVCLAFLFSGEHAPVHVLPPHALEMRWFLAGVDRKVAHEGRLLQIEVRALWDELRVHTEIGRVLELLESGVTPGDADIELVADAMRNHSSFLVDRLTTFFARLGAYARSGPLWSELVRRRVLSPCVSGNILGHALPQGWLESTLGVQRDVLDGMNVVRTGKKSGLDLAKARDAQALVYLALSNEALKPHNRKLVLFTRDAGLRRSARVMESEDSMSWKEARACVRSADSLFIDVMLLGEVDRHSGRGSLEEAEAAFGRLAESCAELARRSRHAADDSVAVREYLAMLEQAREYWQAYVQAGIWRSASRFGWLHDAHTRQAHPTDAIAGDVELVVQLRELVSSERYLDRARTEFQWAQRQFDLHTLPAMLLSLMTEESVARLSDILAGVVSRSEEDAASSTICVSNVPVEIEFRSGRYVDLASRLRRTSSNSDDFRELLVGGIEGATSSPGGDPEGLLFIAMCLGQLGEWEAAVDVGRAAEGLSQQRSAEILQFLSVALQQVPDGETDHRESLVESYGLALEAVKVHAGPLQRPVMFRGEPRSPRLLCTLATAALRIHNFSLSRGESGRSDSLIGHAEAVALLESISATSLGRPRLVAANNLAFFYLQRYRQRQDEDLLSRAVTHLNSLARGLAASPEFETVMFLDTIHLCTAAVAHRASDVPTLRAAVDALHLLRHRRGLAPREKQSVDQSLSTARGWLADLRAGF